MSPVGPFQDLPPIEVDDSTCFRRTITYQSQAMQSLDEALEALSMDKHDARAHQFMGWWHLTQEKDFKRARDHLEAAEESGIVAHQSVNK